MEPTYYTTSQGADINTAPITTSTIPEPKSNLQKLFTDPNFQSLLAGIGARLDPQGVGGALGGATQEYIKAKAAQSAAQALTARNAPPTKLTPEGVPGPTSETHTRNADGTYTTTTKGDSVPVTAAPATSAAPVVEPPITPTVPTTATPATLQATPSRMSDLPFSLAPTQGPLDFRGLSAEQVPQILEAYHAGEKLRQANVGQILAAHEQDSLAAARSATTAVHQETVAQMRRLAPFDVPKIQAEIRRLQNTGDVSELQANALRDTASLNLPLAKQELAKSIAGTNAQNASAEASRASVVRAAQSAQQEQELFDINKPAAKAAAALYDVTDAEGRKVTLTGKDMKDYLAHQTVGIESVRQHDIAAREKALTHAEHAATFAAAQQKSEAERTKIAAGAELNLIEPKDSKGDTVSAQAAAPEADLFNLHSTKPYVYVYFPKESGTGIKSLVGYGKPHPDYSDKNVPVPIPQLDRSKFPDMPRTAREVNALATSMGVSVRRVIEMMYDRGMNDPATPPKDRVKAPWLR